MHRNNKICFSYPRITKNKITLMLNGRSPKSRLINSKYLGHATFPTKFFHINHLLALGSN